MNVDFYTQWEDIWYTSIAVAIVVGGILSEFGQK